MRLNATGDTSENGREKGHEPKAGSPRRTEREGGVAEAWRTSAERGFSFWL